MIAKGTAHNDGVKLARYMITGKTGERAELWQLRGFAADNIVDAFRDVHVMAEGTRAEQPFFHVQVRNPNGEELTRAQWERIANRIESKLGLTGQPRAIAFHTGEADGHEHMHIAWSRIDQDTMTARPQPYFKLRLKEVSRELEIKLNLTRVRNEVEGPIKYAPTRAEEEQARRLGVDIRKTRLAIRDSYDRSDCGRSFEAALAHEGLMLVKGDDRDFLVVDHAGGMHLLGKRILGVSASKIRERLSDIDREHLPTLEQARAHIAGHVRDRQQQKPEPMWDRDRYHAGWEDAVRKAAIEKEKMERRFVEPKPERTKGQGRREKSWPITPPRPEPIQTSPAYHFEDAARDITRNRQPQPEPKKLTGMSLQLAELQHHCDNDRAFAAALDQKGIVFARVTREEADRSAREAAFAKEIGRHAPRYREGEIVAVKESWIEYRRNDEIMKPGSRVHKLDQSSAQDFLKALRNSPKLQGLDATRQASDERARQRTAEWQAIRLENATRKRQPARIRGGNAPAAIAKSPLRAMNILGRPLELIGNAFESLFAPKLTPEQIREGKIAAQERKADARDQIELSNAIGQRAQERQQDKEREAARERQREADRER
jgi:relaxase-like protein